ncbi:MAG: shikimate dehydrogenase [Solirubrobacterales bacterium]
MSRRFTFIGVSTADSSIMGVFPLWREALDLGDDVEIEGWDLELGAPDAAYAAAVDRLAADPDNLGALVTTHKLGLMRAAADRFDELDEDARLLGEISCIAKRDGLLLGSAKDPMTAAGALEAIVATDHFAGGAEALVMGAGGAGTAIATYLAARRADRPRRIVVTDTAGDRLDHLREIGARLGCGQALELRIAADGVHDELLAGLPAGSLVVNATGMGKDGPGSPLADAAVFPRGGIAWELNYRGELGFLRQAETQRAERELTIADGWGYFIRGWAAVIEEVFRRPIDEDELELLSREAAVARAEPKEERDGG